MDPQQQHIKPYRTNLLFEEVILLVVGGMDHENRAQHCIYIFPGLSSLIKSLEQGYI